MGSWSSRVWGPRAGVAEGAAGPRADRAFFPKRKRGEGLSESGEESGEEGEERLLGTPRRKKIKSTSRYIYQTLFLNGEQSDVKICALGEEWNLHKIYLCQSGYFSSMFSGSWRESGMDTIELEIPDRNIDVEDLSSFSDSRI